MSLREEFSRYSNERGGEWSREKELHDCNRDIRRIEEEGGGESEERVNERGKDVLRRVQKGVL